MPAGPGREVKFAAGIQGNAQSEVAPTVFLPHSGSDFGRMIEYKDNEDALGVRDKRINQVKLRDYGKGPIAGNVDIDTLMWLYQNVFGNAGVSASSGNIRTITFAKPTPGASRPYNTLYCVEPNVNEKFVGGVMDKLELMWATDSWMKYTSEWTTLKAETNTTALPSVPDSILFAPSGTKLESAQNVAGLSAGLENEVKSVKITISNETEPYPKLNSTEFASIPSKGLMIDIEIVALFKGFVERNKWIANAFESLRLTADAERARGAHDVITQQVLQFNKVKYGEFKPGRSLDSLMEQTINAKAYYDPSSSQEKTLSGIIRTNT